MMHDNVEPSAVDPVSPITGQGCSPVRSHEHKTDLESGEGARQENAGQSNQSGELSKEKKINFTTCHGDEFFALCERSKRKDIWIYSIAVAESNAQYVVEWSER